MVVHRLQTDALLQGHFYLSPKPFGYPHDYIWLGHGMQQSWGMGVPFMRLPFEWGARQFKFGPFPDRVVLLFYLIVMVVLLNISLKRITGVLGFSAFSMRGLFIRWYLIAWVLFSSGIGALSQQKIDIYNETVLYGCIYCCLLFSLFLIYINRPHDRLFCILCAASGFACFIRPTLVAYGFATVALASGYLYKDKGNCRLMIGGIFCFLLMGFMDLWINYLRFGSMTEFGYSGQLDGGLLIDFSWRFGSPFHHEPFLSAARELVGALFFNNRWASHTIRFREFHFRVFNFSHLIVLVSAFILYVFFLFNKFVNRRSSDRTKSPGLSIIFLSLAWGFISFGLLSAFYVNCPALAGRYICEFSMAVNAVFIALILFLCRFKSRIIIYAVFFVMAVFFYTTNAIYFQNGHQYYKGKFNILTVDKNQVSRLVAAFNRDIQRTAHLPEISYCGQSHPPKSLRFQYDGWDIRGDCSVRAVTSAILPSRRYVTINYSIKDSRQMPDLRLKRDLIFFESVSLSQKVDQSKFPYYIQITQRFYTDAPILSPYALYSIGWKRPDQFTYNKLPVILNWLSVSNR